MPSPLRIRSATMPAREEESGWRMGPGRLGRRREILVRGCSEDGVTAVASVAGLGGDMPRFVGVSGWAGDEIVLLKRSAGRWEVRGV